MDLVKTWAETISGWPANFDFHFPGIFQVFPGDFSSFPGIFMGQYTFAHEERS